MIKVFTFLFLFVSFASKSQDGVFLTADDFIENHVLRPANSRMRERFATVCLKNDTSRIVYSAQNAFGYRYEGRLWRFTAARNYEILATEGIWVYRVQNATDLSTYSYYFSDGAYGEVFPLTRNNIKKHFSTQPEFLTIIKKLDWRMDLFQPTNYKSLPLISALYMQLMNKSEYHF